MAVKKLQISDIPKQKLDELKPLLQSECEYVAIGKSVYEIYPVSAMKLLNVLSKIVTIIKNIQRKKEDEFEKLYGIEYEKAIESNDEEKIREWNIKKSEYIKITQSDIFSDEDSIEIIKEILLELLEGVDEDDINNITTGQLADVITKLINVNINTLPQSAKNKLLGINNTNISDINKLNVNINEKN